MDKIINLISSWISNKLTGKIIINFYQGGITSWKIEETFKPSNEDLRKKSVNISSGKYVKP